MAWRLAKGLATLRQQINDAYPLRSTGSDGTKGDPAHASRKSDHNPDSRGIVHALDLTHDPRHGFDSYRFAEWLRERKDPRIDYVISNGRIFAGDAGPSPWRWREYTGVNPHDHHIHISIRGQGFEDLPNLWNITEFVASTPLAADRVSLAKSPKPTLKLGAVGTAVRDLQLALKIPADAIFGKATKAAVQKAQKAAGIVADGVVGPQTWKVIDGAA